MDRVEGKIFSNEIVQIDGKCFVNCSFDNCFFYYEGGRCEWENTSFSNCRVTLCGAANNTTRVLQALGFSITASKSDVLGIT